MGDRNGAQIALMAFGLTGLVVIPFWTFIYAENVKTPRLDGRQFLSLTCALGFLVNPATSQNMVILNYIAMSIRAGAFAITFWGMLPDTVEYGEWKTGHRVGQWSSALRLLRKNLPLRSAPLFSACFSMSSAIKLALCKAKKRSAAFA